MKAHRQDMYAAWARDWGIEGFDHWDPKNREKHRMRELKRKQKNDEKRNKEKVFN